MRVKDYDYDTVVKFKNPLRDFNVVLDFVEKNFELINEIEFIPGCKTIHYEHAQSKIVVLYDLEEEDLSFFIYDDEKFIDLGETFYILGYNKMPYIREESSFEHLKSFFLNHKLNEKLSRELKEKQQTTTKKKLNKI